MFNKRLGLLALTCAFALLTGAVCIPRTTTRMGTLRVSITDAPFPFQFISEAIVTVTSVEVRLGEGSETGGETTENGSDNDFITVFSNPSGTDFDLLTLRNGVTELLAQAQVPIGIYTQMRLIISLLLAQVSVR